jgi:hypothetical protein
MCKIQRISQLPPFNNNGNISSKCFPNNRQWQPKRKDQLSRPHCTRREAKMIIMDTMIGPRKCRQWLGFGIDWGGKQFNKFIFSVTNSEAHKTGGSNNSINSTGQKFWLRIAMHRVQ